MTDNIIFTKAGFATFGVDLWARFLVASVPPSGNLPKMNAEMVGMASNWPKKTATVQSQFEDT